MNNLFKKGFASLALASAMTSSIFAGNAAYIDIKVNYLGGKGEAVLGYEGTATSNDNRDKVELLVTILDKDGAYATKNKNGSADIDDVTLEGFSVSADTNSSKPLNVQNTNSAVVTQDSTVVASLGRDLDENTNIRRYIIDYTFAVESKLEDEITFFTGTGASRLERKITINLGSVDAEGLLVRATPNGTFKTDKYINAHFYDINVTGGAKELNASSSKAPGGLVGLSIPIQVYASTLTHNSSVDGRFTFAPNLEGKTIVVQALADYNENNATQTVLNSIEITMKNGQATGDIVITNALPGGIDEAVDVNPRNDEAFEDALTEGLGIAFLVYVKDEIGTNNYPALLTTNNLIKTGTFDTNITVWGDATDTIQVKSGEPAKLMVGAIDKDAKKISKLWTSTSSLITIVDGNGTNDVDDGIGLLLDVNTTHATGKTLTVVDSYGNPAIVSGTITSKVRFGSDTTSKLVKVEAGQVAVANGISTISVAISDSQEINNTRAIKPVKFTVDASNGMLAAVDAVSLTVNTLPLIEWKVDGGSVWKKAIADINTTAAFIAPDNFPTVALADVVRVTQNDFTVIIKSGIGDTNVSDHNSTFRVYIKDNSGESDSGYLEGSDLTKYSIDAINGQGATFGTAGLFGSTTITAGTGGTRDKIGDGYIRFDFNSSNGTLPSYVTGAKDSNFTLVISKEAAADVVLANIKVVNYNAGDNEEEVVIEIPTYEDKKINAFVEVYSDGEVDLGEVKPGTIINFKFTGMAVSTGDKIEIDMNSTATATAGLNVNGKTNTVGRIGLVGSDIADNTDGKITTTLPENGIVSVVLYDANSTDKFVYGFNGGFNGTSNNNSAVLINNARPVWLYLKENGDTDSVTEYNTSAQFTMVRLDDNSIAKVRMGLTTNASGDGTADDKRKSLPEEETASTDPITAKGNTVLTGTYYGLFDGDTAVSFLDMYNNPVSGLKDELKKDAIFTATSGIEFDNDGTNESWIKFKESAAGTEQTLTVSYEKDDKTKVSNTITWTKIKLSKKNSGFVITNDANGFVDPNTGLFSVENSEIIVKIIGNGNTKQSATKITLSHSNKDAKVRLVKVAGMDDTTIYENALSGLDSSIKDTIQVGGSYYIVSTDKAGDLNIKVDSTVKDAKDNDVAITGTHKITFDAIDLDKPMVIESGVVASGGTITVEVTDKNLNTIATTVTVSDINDNTKSIVKAVYTDGKYVATVGSAGIYQVEILGVDMAENMQRFNFARTLGKAGTLEDSLVAHGSYVIDGTFASYDFKDVDSSFDWVYTQGETMNQLNAKDSVDESAFKWGTVTDITPGTKNVWYMIKLTGPAGSSDASGAYGWVLVNAKGDTFKLAGANSDGTFMFSKALYVKGTMTGSNISFAKR